MPRRAREHGAAGVEGWIGLDVSGVVIAFASFLFISLF
jgi:hypothetical protein